MRDRVTGSRAADVYRDDMRCVSLRVGLPTLALLATVTAATDAAAGRTLDDYRHFRALSIDLQGRMPTLDEVTAFEKPDFDLDRWIDAHLSGTAYADRLVRVYLDLLRLDVGPAVQFANDGSTLYRRVVTLPDGREVFVYFRKGQRRLREETDGDFCLGGADVSREPIADPKHKAHAAHHAPPHASASASAKPGAPPPPMGPNVPMKIFTTEKALDEGTVAVKPWWLYRDYASATPSQRYREGWKDADPAYQPVDPLLVDPDKKPTIEIRVCKEEAQDSETGHVHATARKAKAGTPPPFPRTTNPPLDAAYATAHRGESVTCTNRLAHQSSPECGCGRGLERCVPTVNDDRLQIGNAFVQPLHAMPGQDGPIDSVPQQTGKWFPRWWSEEAVVFLRHLFADDRDFRDVLLAKDTWVNGPLTQFYRSVAPASCCGAEASFGMTQELEPLLQPTSLPTGLLPHDVARWEHVKDRGPHASGILTMPIFLEKFASRRARGAAVYTAFLCKSFVAEAVELAPSSEPNLTVRPGCATCHATLEPLAAYFSRVEETSWTFLPQQYFPTQNLACKKNAQGKLPGFCNTFYDADFGDEKGAMLRGAYASPAHANAEPAGAGRELASSPDFARCAVSRVTASFLGRSLTSDDDALIAKLTEAFVAKGMHPRALVGALVRAPAYATSNNLSSASVRAHGGAK